MLVRDAKPFRAWAKGTAPLRIFFAYDFDNTGDLALSYLAKWAGGGELAVTVAHVDRPPEEYSRPGISRHRAGSGNEFWNAMSARK